MTVVRGVVAGGVAMMAALTTKVGRGLNVAAP